MPSRVSCATRQVCTGSSLWSTASWPVMAGSMVVIPWWQMVVTAAAVASVLRGGPGTITPPGRRGDGVVFMSAVLGAGQGGGFGCGVLGLGGRGRELVAGLEVLGAFDADAGEDP